MNEGWYILLAVTLIGYNGEREEVDLSLAFPMFQRTELRNPNIEAQHPIQKSCKDRWLEYFNKVEQKAAETYNGRIEATHWKDAKFKYKYISK